MLAVLAKQEWDIPIWRLQSKQLVGLLEEMRWTKSNLIWARNSLCQKKLPQKWPQIDFDRDCYIERSTTVEGEKRVKFELKFEKKGQIWVKIRSWGSRSPGGRIIVHIWQRKKPSGGLIDSGQDPCQLTDLQEVGIWLVALPVWLLDEENLSQRAKWRKEDHYLKLESKRVIFWIT